MKYKLISNLIAWLFPTKQDRRRFRKFCKELESRKQIDIIQKRYEQTKKRLKEKVKTQKLNVLFICSENSKWSYQSLYDLMLQDDKYSVKVVISIPEEYVKQGEGICQNLLKQNYLFFTERNMPVEYAFDTATNNYIDLKVFEPDIIFYDQPWGVPDKHSIINTSNYALCFSCTYGANITNGENEIHDFYKSLYIYFVDNDFIIPRLLESGFEEKHICNVGHLKLDAYQSPINQNNIKWKTKDKKHVIYAPHFSFSKDSILRYGTFNWNYDYILRFAQENSNIEFVLKPHPKLKSEIVEQGLMSEKEMFDYFKQWEMLPNAQIYEQGDYIDLFRTSDCLITDCNSFLYEYLPTQKPVIHLISEYSVGHTGFGNQITSGYYKVYDIEDLKETLNAVVIRSEDTLKEKRVQNINKILNKQKNVLAAQNVSSTLKKIIEGDNND